MDLDEFEALVGVELLDHQRAFLRTFLEDVPSARRIRLPMFVERVLDWLYFIRHDGLLAGIQNLHDGRRCSCWACRRPYSPGWKRGRLRRALLL